MQQPLTIVATYNDLDIFPQILSGLINDGLHVHIIDNWSSDGTYEFASQIASEFPDAVSIERFPESGPTQYFEWRSILRRKEEIALRWPGRWISHQDSDEVRCSPWPAMSFHQGLRRASSEGFSAIEFAVIRFRPVDDCFRPGMNPEMHFRYFERDNSNASQVKAWRQPATRVELAKSGGHGVAFPGLAVHPEKFLMKHYPIRSLEQGRRKIFEERLGRFHPDELAIGWHFQYDCFKPNEIKLWIADDLLQWDAT
jgi:hypothetical protein